MFRVEIESLKFRQVFYLKCQSHCIAIVGLVFMLDLSLHANQIERVQVDFNLSQGSQVSGLTSYLLLPSSTEIGFRVLLLDGVEISDLIFTHLDDSLDYEITNQSIEVIEGTLKLERIRLGGSTNSMAENI